MPELPEVETTRRGIEPHVVKHKVQSVAVRQPSLRWPVPADLPKRLKAQTLLAAERRGKYLLLRFNKGTLLVHLGMSGSLRVVVKNTLPMKHDHLDICFDNDKCLRLNDPRRFGAVLWAGENPLAHELLDKLGPEPLSDAFNADYLFTKSRKRKTSVKNFIMDSRIVVGVGNIYASEALFAAGIHPKRAAGHISKARYASLVTEIKTVLEYAITRGGTTLRNFLSADGVPGYFALELKVYGRADEPCVKCGAAIRSITIGQRASYFCPHCQR